MHQLRAWLAVGVAQRWCIALVGLAGVVYVITPAMILTWLQPIGPKFKVASTACKQRYTLHWLNIPGTDNLHRRKFFQKSTLTSHFDCTIIDFHPKGTPLSTWNNPPILARSNILATIFTQRSYLLWRLDAKRYLLDAPLPSVKHLAAQCFNNQSRVLPSTWFNQVFSSFPFFPLFWWQYSL